MSAPTASTLAYQPRSKTLAALALSIFCCATFAQTTTPAARIEAPDGVPELAAEKTLSNASGSASAKPVTSVIVEEERVQGRLANARISVGGGKGYTVVDPNAGRTDRQADNGGKRVSPSLWELFRF